MSRTITHFPIYQIVEEMLPGWMASHYKRELALRIEQHLILCGKSYWLSPGFDLYICEHGEGALPVLLLDRIPERVVREVAD